MVSSVLVIFYCGSLRMRSCILRMCFGRILVQKRLKLRSMRFASGSDGLGIYVNTYYHRAGIITHFVGGYCLLLAIVFFYDCRCDCFVGCLGVVLFGGPNGLCFALYLFFRFFFGLVLLL